jgi:demethylmenaquinone methyltransferase/2-methoxy-6-polyprenyl-1,4-benzoquinol methylase
LILEVSRPGNPVVLRMMRFYMRKLLPRIAWLRRRDRSTAKLVEYYWATIEECVPPERIISALNDRGFRDVQRTTIGAVLSEYVARR